MVADLSQVFFVEFHVAECADASSNAKKQIGISPLEGLLFRLGINTHVPPILMFTRGFLGFDPPFW